MSIEDPCYISRAVVAKLRPAIVGTRFTGLYVAGTLEGLAAPTVAIVGSRAPSDAGRRLARTLAKALGRAGVCVLSGLALGIDGCAHQGAVDAQAPTIGILGGGHRRFHPRGNRTLAEGMIGACGAVISPFTPDQPARPHQFIQRNALIAALADGVVIVEAAQRSGSLNTAGWAGDLGIPVFAFPGDVDRPKVAGCLALIRDGATLVRNADDVLEGIGLHRTPTAQPETYGTRALSSPELALLSHLHEGEASLDDLLESHPGNPSEVPAMLVQLELHGLIERRSAGRFAALHDIEHFPSRVAKEPSDEVL